MRRLGAPAGRGGRARRLAAGLAAVPGGARRARGGCAARGWKLAILSNSDPDLIAASKELLGVPFDETVVAGEIRSYKPAPKHWLEFYARTLADKRRARPRRREPLPRHRPGGPAADPERLDQPPRRAPRPTPTRELPDLTELPDTLDELVPDVAAPPAPPATARAGLRSKITVAMTETENRRQGRAGGAGAGREEAPEHLPELRVALPRRRARGDALRLRALRPPLPDARPGPDRLACRPGSRSSRRPPRSAPPTRSRSSTCARTRSGSPRPSSTRASPTRW